MFRCFYVLLLLCCLGSIECDQIWHHRGLVKPSTFQDHKTIASIALGCNKTYQQPGIIHQSDHGITISLHVTPDAAVINVQISSTKTQLDEVINTKCNMTAQRGCVGHMYWLQHKLVKDRVPYLAKYLTSMQISTPYIITAYGVAGGLAQLIAYQLVTMYKLSVDSLILFGSPSAGDKEFSNYLCSRTNCFRYFHPQAIVPLFVDPKFEFGVGVDQHYDANNTMLIGPPRYPKIHTNGNTTLTFQHLALQIKKLQVNNDDDVLFFELSKC